jgi:hypothetical protein
MPSWKRCFAGFKGLLKQYRVHNFSHLSHIPIVDLIRTIEPAVLLKMLIRNKPDSYKNIYDVFISGQVILISQLMFIRENMGDAERNPYATNNKSWLSLLG